MQHFNWILVAGLLAATTACSKPQTPVSEPKNGGIVRGDATDLPIYNKSSGSVVDITKFPADVQQLFKQIDPAPHIEAYHKAEGHYPADYAEFKSGVMEPNNLKFPSKLPGGMQLQYDEAGHRVVVVRTGKKT